MAWTLAALLASLPAGLAAVLLEGHLPARVAARLLAPHLQGSLAIARLSWRPPTVVEAHGLRLRAPGAPPEAADLVWVGRARATVDLASLQRRHLRLPTLEMEGARVDLAAPNSPELLAAALQPRAAAPTAPGPSWSVALDDVRPRDARVRATVGGAALQATGRGGHLALAYDGGHTALEGSLALAVDGPLAAGSPAGALFLEATVAPTVWASGDGDGGAQRLLAPAIEVRGEQLAGGAAISLSPGSRGHLAVAGHVAATPTWRATLPAAWQAAAASWLPAGSDGGGSLTGWLARGPDGDAGAASLIGDGLTLGHLEVRGAELSAQSRSGRWAFDAHAALAPQARLALHGEVALARDAESWRVLGHRLELVGERLAPAAWAAARGARALALALPAQAGLHARAEGTRLDPAAPASRLTATASLRAWPPLLRGLPGAVDLEVDANLQPGWVEVTALRLLGDGINGGLQGKLGTRPQDRVDLAGHLRLARPTPLLGRLIPRLAAGNLGLAGRVFGPWRQLAAEGQLDGRAVRWRGGGRLQLTAPFAWGRGRLELRRARLRHPTGSVEITGSLRPAAGRQPTLVDGRIRLGTSDLTAWGSPVGGSLRADLRAQGPLADPEGTVEAAWGGATLAGAPPLDLALRARGHQHRVAVESLSILDPSTDGSGVVAHGTVDPVGRRLALIAEVRGVAAATVAAWAQVEEPVGGTLEGSVRVDGPVAAPAVAADLAASELRVGPVTLGRVEATVASDAQAYRAHLDVRQKDSLVAANLYLGRPASRRAGQIWGDFDLHPLGLQSFVPSLAGADADLAMRAHGTFHRAHQGTALAGEATIEALVAAARGEALSLTEPVAVRLADDEVEVGKTTLAGTAGDLVFSGRGSAHDLRGMVRGQVNLDLLGSFVPQVGAARGRLEVAARATGNPREPTLNGQITIIEPVGVRLKAWGQELVVNGGTAAFDRNHLHLRRIHGGLGQGTLEIDGAVALRRARPTHWDVRLRGQNVPLRSPDLLLESDLQLALAGDGAIPTLGGQITITRGRYTRQLVQLEQLFAHRTPPPGPPPPPPAAADPNQPSPRDVPLDIEVVTGEDLAVRVDASVAMIRADLRADLHIGGRLAAPKLSGQVASTSGSLRFSRASLDLTQAQVTLRPRPRGGTSAVIGAVAEGLVRTHDANESIEVGLELAGEVDGSMRLTTRSVPSLGPNRDLDILALLTTGRRNLAEALQGGDDRLASALGFAGSYASEPLARFAADQLERRLKTRVDLGVETTDSAVRVRATKQIASRLRVEGDYSYAYAADTAAAAGAQATLSVTDQLLLVASGSVGANNGSADQQSSRSTLELKWRFLGH